ncbi:MAG: ABC transporter ATP-binding protein [Candidatus Bathyarchaeia archaeon]
MSAPLIELVNVSKYFGYGIMGIMGLTRFPAVDGVSLTISGDKPEVLTLVGESGCGKSTLAKIMLRVLRPTHGVVNYRGQDMWKLSKSEVRRFIKDVQPIFQDPLDTFNMFETVEGYLKSVAKNLLKLDREQIGERIARTLEFVGLAFDRVKGKRPHEFSGGELQRVSIARALLAQPKLLIADEPVSMVDASLRISILNLLSKAKDELGTSIVYITHDLATASYIGEKVAVMYRGAIVEQGYLEKVINEPLHPYTKVLLDSLPDYTKGREWFNKQLPQTLRTVIEAREMLLQGCKYFYYCPFRTQQCREKPVMISVGKDHKVACWMYYNMEGSEKRE